MRRPEPKVEALDSFGWAELHEDWEQLSRQVEELRELVLSEARRRRQADAVLQGLLTGDREVLSPALPFPEEDNTRSFQGTQGTTFVVETQKEGVSRIQPKDGGVAVIPTSDLHEWMVAQLKQELFGGVLALPPEEFLVRLSRAVQGMLSLEGEM